MLISSFKKSFRIFGNSTKFYQLDLSLIISQGIFGIIESPFGLSALPLGNATNKQACSQGTSLHVKCPLRDWTSNTTTPIGTYLTHMHRRFPQFISLTTFDYYIFKLFFLRFQSSIMGMRCAELSRSLEK